MYIRTNMFGSAVYFIVYMIQTAGTFLLIFAVICYMLYYKTSIAQNNVNKTTNSLAYSTSNHPMLQEVTERS